LAAIRFHFVGWFLAGLGAAVALAIAIVRLRFRRALSARYPSSLTVPLGGLAMAQEVSNVVEAYLILAWLGASPTLASIIVLEGLSRLMNSAGQFIPGKLGITEAATTALAEGLRLGGAHGLSLALARRIRSLLWGAIGIGFVTARAAATVAETAPRAETAVARL
jgi:hypothetical protein